MSPPLPPIDTDAGFVGNFIGTSFLNRRLVLIFHLIHMSQTRDTAIHS